MINVGISGVGPDAIRFNLEIGVGLLLIMVEESGHNVRFMLSAIRIG